MSRHWTGQRARFTGRRMPSRSAISRSFSASRYKETPHQPSIADIQSPTRGGVHKGYAAASRIARRAPRSRTATGNLDTYSEQI
jgi:hypothetical protein